MPVSGAFEKRLLAAMIRAVQAGGRIVRRHFASSRLEVREKSSPADLVSNVDLEVEHRMIRILSTEFPGAAVVSEERVNPQLSAEAFYLDPLDGTLNFLHGLLPFAISLAYWREAYRLDPQATLQRAEHPYVRQIMQRNGIRLTPAMLR